MGPRPSYTQIEALVEFLEQNPGIAKGCLRTSSAKAETKKKWASVAITLNALGGTIKDGVGWAKYWAEKKCGLKKVCAEHNASVIRMGGDPADSLPRLSELEKRMIEIMGGQQSAVGDTGLSVNPFPDIKVNIVKVLDERGETESPPVSGESDSLVTATSSASEATVTEDRERSPIRNPPPPPRPRRARARGVSRRVRTEMHRLIDIEERRIDAELLTAQAFTNLASSIQRIAVAQEKIATALVDLARRLPLNNE